MACKHTRTDQYCGTPSWCAKEEAEQKAIEARYARRVHSGGARDCTCKVCTDRNYRGELIDKRKAT